MSGSAHCTELGRAPTVARQCTRSRRARSGGERYGLLAGARDCCCPTADTELCVNVLQVSADSAVCER